MICHIDIYISVFRRNYGFDECTFVARCRYVIYREKLAGDNLGVTLEIN